MPSPIIKPLADKVTNFRDKVEIFNNELKVGHQASLDGIIDLFNKVSDLKLEAKSAQGNLEAQIDGLNAAMPKPPMVALMVKTLVFLAQELIALVQMVQAIVQIITLMTETLQIYMTNVIQALIAESIDLAKAVQKYIQEQIIEKMRKRLIEMYDKMVKKLSASLKKAKYEAKIKALTKQIEALKGQESNAIKTNVLLYTQLLLKRINLEEQLKQYQSSLASLESS